MKYKFLKIYTLLTLVILHAAIVVQPVSASTTGTVEANPRLVRQNTTFLISITLTSDDELQVQQPAFPDPDGVSLSNQEIEPVQNENTESGQTEYIYTFQAEYYADEEGEYEIGPFRVTYNLAGIETQEIVLDAVMVEIYDDAPRPVSDIIEGNFQFPWRTLLIIFLAALFIALLAGWIYLRRRKPEAAPGLTIGPFKSPEQVAYEEIKNLKLPAADDVYAVKEYYDSVDDILRKYLFKRYSVITGDVTNWEIQQEFHRRKRLDSRSKGVFILINDCDWVKFAKSRPSTNEISAVTKRARDILLGIRPSGKG